MSVAVGLSPLPILQFFGNDGKPAVGGSLLTQVGGVNYPTYSDPNGTIPLPDPIPLNSRGEASTAIGSSTTVFLQQGVSYTFTLFDINGNQLWSIGNIVANQLQIPYAAASGTNSIVATFNPALPSLFDGLTVNVKLVNTTTASPTFNPNGLGALNVYYSDGTTQWVAGSGIAGVTYTLVYNSSLNSNAGGWQVQNPSRATGSFTITLTGMTTTVTGIINYVIGNDGKSVDFWYVSTITGTSNTTAMTGTGIPAIITPATSKRLTPFTVEDSNNNVTGNLVTGTSSTWTFGNSLGNAVFTGLATKGLGAAGSTNHYTVD